MVGSGRQSTDTHLALLRRADVGGLPCRSGATTDCGDAALRPAFTLIGRGDPGGHGRRCRSTFRKKKKKGPYRKLRQILGWGCSTISSAFRWLHWLFENPVIAGGRAMALSKSEGVACSNASSSCCCPPLEKRPCEE